MPSETNLLFATVRLRNEFLKLPTRDKGQRTSLIKNTGISDDSEERANRQRCDQVAISVARWSRRYFGIV
ncbi:unnamed protein product [Acanthoscelides obtectus]|uniref:Uncharacterized protein n=1 Tax=Acanthoscelides obtectus TaxID=200917 RepID=A0A9P0P8D9_ACAOB|nr:unnamed protein product [Acanthoscelides obtectus]CAK1632361.1 hypothetical protein AOBTE_LOCUS7503 [Acanthoscelides obtectus]